MTLGQQSRAWAVVQFPGSNCDYDSLRVVQALSAIDSKIRPVLHWHDEPIQKNQYQVIILPGGFSYGDYLRAGAIAKMSKAMENFDKVIDAGAHVMGICNGFQILLEMKLLPGFLQVNEHLRFVSKTIELKIEQESFPWFKAADIGRIVKMPIAHRFGNYNVSTMDQSEVETALTYVTNPNGSYKSTAGIYRKHGKSSIFGMMPHPERSFFEALRLSDAAFMWKNAVEVLQ